MALRSSLSSSCYSTRTSDLASRHCALTAHRRGVLSFDLKSTTCLKLDCRSISRSNRGPGRSLLVRKSFVRASSESSPPIAPLQMESPIGQFLSEILISHPHLLPAAVEQQLAQLQTDRETAKSKDEPSPSTDIVLYRRIAEVKANERKRALEEILYALVVQKFMEANISLVPAITQPSDRSQRVDQWLHEDERLEQIHSPEAYEMIQNHLAVILGKRLADPKSVAPISKLRVGQVYAASIMYGYFLKRVDQRFQLEKSMKSLPWGSNEEGTSIKQSVPGESMHPLSSHPEVSSGSYPSFSADGFDDGINKPSRLRSYVMSFDSKTLQNYATIRSKEAFGIIEKHTEALFGTPEIALTQGTIDSSKDEIIKISFGGLKRLILEAVSFGSFLWDVESHVDSRYRFVAN